MGCAKKGMVRLCLFKIHGDTHVNLERVIGLEPRDSILKKLEMLFAWAKEQTLKNIETECDYIV